jgi:regulator of sirC expression with transglutaminase-like and TPR domain
VFHAVCRRVGISIQMIGFPCHFLIGWLDDATNEPQRYFIDVFNQCQMLSMDDCRELADSRGFELRADHLEVISPAQVFVRMLLNIEGLADRNRMN